MKTILLEAPRPNSSFAKYKSLYTLPNILLDIAGVLNDEVIFIDALRERNEIKLPDADRYIVNISECVESTKKDIFYAERLLNQLKILQSSQNKEIYLSGFYSWLNRLKLENDSFKVLEALHYEEDLCSYLNISYKLSDPRWDLIDWLKVPSNKKGKLATFRTSRGCHRVCKMCPIYLIHNSKMYQLPIEYCKEQILKLYKDYNVREIDFLDDNLLVNKTRAIELLTFLSDERKKSLKGMTYTFREGLEVDQAIDEDIISLLKKSGFHHIKLGVESFNEKSLKYINKSYNDPELAIKAIETLKKYKLKPVCFMLVGIPTDTEEDIKNTIDMFVKLKVKVRAQLIIDYMNINDKSLISVERLKELKNEALERTGSLIWRKKK